MAGTQPLFLRRVALTNYRSIAACDVALRPLTFLVGPNGSGKSNFLDAIRLVSDSLRNSLDHALRERGGISEVRRRSSGHPNNFAVRLDFELEPGRIGYYAFEISTHGKGSCRVKREVCRLGANKYEVREGTISVPPSPSQVAPPASIDRLYLTNAAGIPAFRPVFDALSGMGFYNLNPAVMRELQVPDTGDLLSREGANLASVLHRLSEIDDGRPVRERINEYLSRVAPGVEGVHRKAVENKETIEFRQRVEGALAPWRFSAYAMSDGTLRALGIVIALFQARAGRVRMVGIEEPEAALHPGAAAVLRDLLRDASTWTQVLVTSHSPELLDDPEIDADEFLAVDAHEGTTRIGRLNEAGTSALRDRLFTAGELLRANQVEPEPKALLKKGQTSLFDARNEQ